MIWSHLFEVIMMISNPVVILPYGCGFVSGIIDNFLMTTEVALAHIAIGFFIAAAKFVSTILSATNRFLFTFKPNLRKYIDNKYFYTVLVFAFAVFLAIVVRYLYTSEATYSSIRERARQETGNVLVKYFDKPTFIYARNMGEKIQSSYIFLLIYCNLYSLFMICIIAWFIRMVLKLRKTAKTVSQATISLLLMTLIQLLTNVIFLIMPMSVVLASAGFFIEGSANMANALVSMITYHGLIEMLGVLYSVVPYRKYCVRKLFCIKDSQVFVGVPKLISSVGPTLI
uniref:Serpentine Receptor, class J n=1 Tax=Panagrellus redivivus TaxID=6233 RepID=A0A7E4VD59_PANRE